MSPVCFVCLPASCYKPRATPACRPAGGYTLLQPQLSTQLLAHLCAFPTPQEGTPLMQLADKVSHLPKWQREKVRRLNDGK